MPVRRFETSRALAVASWFLFAWLTHPGVVRARTAIVVYTALEADDLQKYKERFERDVPDVEIRWVRDSTGVITAKLLAEKANPQADLIWGLVATSLMQLDAEGVIEPYAPAALDAVKPGFRDAASPPSWVGMEALIATVCVNTDEAKRHGLPIPGTWKDLLDPVYKGHVVMPDPTSSGTGLLNVMSWLQLMGEEPGWAYLDALDKNVALYTHSGSKPCKLAAAGEYAIGISAAVRGARLTEKGAPLELVFPKEGAGWDLESTSLVRGSKHVEAAKKLADWAVTRAANELYAEGYAVVALPGIGKPPKHYPEDIEARLIHNDFPWMGANRRRILDEWQKRYGAKTEGDKP